MSLLVATNEDVKHILQEIALLNKRLDAILKEVKNIQGITDEWVDQKTAMRLLCITSKSTMRTRIGKGPGKIRACKDGSIYVYNLNDIKERFRLLSGEVLNTLEENDR